MSRTLEIILILAVAYLLWDKFKPTAPSNGKTVTPLNGASTNTAPGIIKNYSEVGDNFDLQVEVLTRELGY